MDHGQSTVLLPTLCLLSPGVEVGSGLCSSLWHRFGRLLTNFWRRFAENIGRFFILRAGIATVTLESENAARVDGMSMGGQGPKDKPN